MTKYEIGQVIPSFIGCPECIKFDIDDSGAFLFVLFNSPTESEIHQFEAGKKAELRFTEINNIIFITVKIGELNWMDAPYSPHLSRNLTKFPILNDKEGLSLTVFLIDSSNGRIKNIRLLGLNNQFSRKLIGKAMEIKVKPFDKSEYDRCVDSIYLKYNTKGLVKMSNNYCRFN